MKRALPSILLALLGAAALWGAWHWSFDHDEVEHLHAAWLVAQGARPFVDFFEHHHPTLWYLAAPLVGLFSDPFRLVVAGRLADLLLLGLFLPLVFRPMVRLLFPGADWRWPAILLLSSFAFIQKWMEFRPDVPMVLASLAGLLAWFLFLARGRWRHAIIAGLLFGAGIAFLQKGIALLLIAAISSWLSLIGPRENGGAVRHMAGAAVMLTAAAVPVGLMSALIWAGGMWQEFAFWNYTFNRFFLGSGEGGAGLLIVKIGRSAAQNPALWLMGIAGALAMAWNLWRLRKGGDECWMPKASLLLAISGSVVFAAMARLPHGQYLLPLFPLLALCSAEAFQRAAGRWGTLARAASAAMVPLAAVIAILFPTNLPQREMQSFVLDRTTSADTIAIPPPYHPIFRKDTSYLWFSASQVAQALEQLCTHRPCSEDWTRQELRRWHERLPSYVYLDPGARPYRWETFAGRYEPTSLSNLLRLAPESR